MNFIVKLIAFFISIPARLKGMKFGKNCIIGAGYDFLFTSLKNITLDDNVIIGRNAYIQTIKEKNNEPEIFIGKGTNINRNATLSCVKKIIIGQKCLMGYNVSILDHDHDVFNPNISPIDSGLTNAAEVIIDDYCFIGAHSFILKGVHLGKHCIIGANSVVTKSFPPYSVIAGNPAKLIRKLQ